MKQYLFVFLVSVGIAVVPMNARAALPDGLAGYWSMDETSGVRADATGNGNNLTPVGTVGYAIGKIGNSVSVGGCCGTFDNMLEHAGFNLGANSFTATAWVPGIDGGNYYLTGGYFVYITDAGENDTEADLEWISGATIKAYISNWDYFTRPAYTQSQPVTSWDFMAVEWDKDAGLLKVKVNNGAWTSVAAPSNHVVASSNLYVGAYGAAMDPDTYPARIDELGLWNRALSDAEISQLYNSGSGLSYADMTATPTPTPVPASGGHTNVGTLIVQKVLIGNSTNIDADDFSYTLDNEPDRFDEETDSKTYIRPVGAHIVHENAFPGYTTTYGGDCDASGSVTVAQDVTRTCIITNTATTPAPSQTPLPGLPGGPTLHGLSAGDLIRAEGDPDVYMVNAFGYKRLFLNPTVFGLSTIFDKFRSVKEVTATVRDVFPTSNLLRDCTTDDQNVYALEVTGEDTGVLHHVQLTGEDATEQDPFFFLKVFCINTREFDWYTTGADYTSLSQVPRYQR